MFVGVLRIALHLPGNDSLKGKRKVVRSFIDRVGAKFNVAVAEVGANDEHRQALIGLTVVGNDRGHVHAMLSKLASFARNMSSAAVWDISTETIPVGDHLEPFEEILGGCEPTEPDEDWLEDEEEPW